MMILHGMNAVERLTISLAVGVSCVLGGSGVAKAQLFAGLEGSAPRIQSTDLGGFPEVTWGNEFSFDVSGAAATPDGLIYVCNGAFTTKLYTTTIGAGSADFVVTLNTDMHSLAYGRGQLYGFSNFAATKGIYEIDTTTGICTLVLDVFTATGFRFFALDYNPVDDLFYGYTEFGASGLYSINIDTGEMLKLKGTIPASNGQGRGMAIGRNTVYLTATRGDDGIPYFAYDLGQGADGEWVPFTQPFPAFHSTGGAAYVAQEGFDISLTIEGDCPGRMRFRMTSGTAGESAALVYSFSKGNFIVPGGICGGTQLGLGGPVKVAAILKIDNSGTAVLIQRVPAGVCGGKVFLQAVDLATCSPSNVVTTP